MTITVFPPISSSSSNASYVQFGGNTVDSFGRLRVSNPYTLYDSQARFAADSTFSYATATGGTTSYNTNKSSVNLNVTTTSGSTVVAQTYRVFPYQPGKSLLTLQTFSMNTALTNLTQRVGYYSAYNGVYLEQAGSQVSFVVRSYTSGTVDNSRFVVQSSWNVDKFDGTGPSGVTLDLTKTQILFLNFEWLGVGNIICGFVINGVFRTAHIFQNANIGTSVYMQTAILPLRYEILTTGTTSGAAVLQQICSTVMSEGGYEQTSQPFVARNPNQVSFSSANTFYPIASIRVNSGYYGAIVLPALITFLPTSNANFEIVAVKNASLTGATWASTLCNGQIDVDTAATAFGTQPSGDSITQVAYATGTNQGSSSAIVPTGYNWELQLGYTASLTGNGFASSDTYTIGARSMTATNTGYGAITFYNLTV
jgi:hypothetical protein